LVNHFWKALTGALGGMLMVYPLPASLFMSFDDRIEITRDITYGTPLEFITVSYPNKVYTWLNATWEVQIIPIVDTRLLTELPVCYNKEPWLYEPRYQARGYRWSLRDYINLSDSQCSLPTGEYLMRTTWEFTPWPLPMWLAFAHKTITIDSNTFEVSGY
jgi:hypothetical protein